MLPHSPGVYRFLDSGGTVIYVGKAKDLKNRVSQYFRPNGLNRKTQVMVSKIADIQHTVVGSESDAFLLENNLLENNLIKQFQPRYNILLKDGKTYPWICLHNEPFPRVTVTRRFVRDGSRASSRSAWTTIWAGVPDRASGSSPRRNTGRRPKLSFRYSRAIPGR